MGRAILFSLSVIFASLVSNYRVFVITQDSIAESIKWEQDQEIAVKLETIRGKTIGLSHWSPELATNLQFFFEPVEVDYIFSCFPEHLPEEAQDLHIFPHSNGINYQGRVGQVVIFSQGIL